MTLQQTASASVKALAYTGRHVMAVSLATVVVAALWTGAYAALLLYAIVFNGGIGSPVAYPAWLCMLVVATLCIGGLVFAPACVAGRLFTAITRLPQLAAIPVVFVVAGVLSMLVYWLFTLTLSTGSLPPVHTMALNYAIFLSLPLGAYWWLVDGPFAIIDGLRRWLRNRHRAAPRRASKF